MSRRSGELIPDQAGSMGTYFRSNHRMSSYAGNYSELNVLNNHGIKLTDPVNQNWKGWLIGGLFSIRSVS